MLVAGSVLLPAALLAAGPADFAKQWPLQLGNPQAGAFRVVLTPQVYRAAHSPSLRDVAVFNNEGDPVPASLFAAAPAKAGDERLQALAWFPLPAGAAARSTNIAVISERNADGSVRRVETRVAGGDAPSSVASNAWLVDASAIRAPIVALELDWAAVDGLDATYRVEGSDDLQAWRSLQAGAQLLDLSRDGQRLQKRRLPLSGHARYLRLSPVQPDAVLPLASVRAVLPGATAASDWQWLRLQGNAATVEGVDGFEFELAGRFPVSRVDVEMRGDAAGEWTLYSRDDTTKATPWRHRAGPWVDFQVGADGASDAQPLDGVVRDRYWRLVPKTPVSEPPVLALAYRPESIVFIAQGSAPWALAAGSARATRADAPVPQLIDTLRAQRGPDWQPASATPGAEQALSGDAAYRPAPVQRDWKSWLLWGVLLAGVLVVTWFALGLLRKPQAD